MEYYSAIKDSLTSFIGKWMYLQTVMLNEINQAYKLNCHMVFLM